MTLILSLSYILHAVSSLFLTPLGRICVGCVESLGLCDSSPAICDTITNLKGQFAELCSSTLSSEVFCLFRPEKLANAPWEPYLNY